MVYSLSLFPLTVAHIDVVNINKFNLIHFAQESFIDEMRFCSVYVSCFCFTQFLDLLLTAPLEDLVSIAYTTILLQLKIPFPNMLNCLQNADIFAINE